MLSRLSRSRLGRPKRYRYYLHKQAGFRGALPSQTIGLPHLGGPRHHVYTRAVQLRVHSPGPTRKRLSMGRSTRATGRAPRDCRRGRDELPEASARFGERRQLPFQPVRATVHPDPWSSEADRPKQAAHVLARSSDLSQRLCEGIRSLDVDQSDCNEREILCRVHSSYALLDHWFRQ